jgi:hypothetical protein
VNSQLQEIADRVDASIEDLISFLDSPSGRRLRGRLATGLIVSVPLIMRIPGLKRSPIGRLIELGGGAVLLIKLAELLRDWERRGDGHGEPQVIDASPPSPAG